MSREVLNMYRSVGVPGKGLRVDSFRQTALIPVPVKAILFTGMKGVKEIRAKAQNQKINKF